MGCLCPNIHRATADLSNLTSGIQSLGRAQKDMNLANRALANIADQVHSGIYAHNIGESADAIAKLSEDTIRQIARTNDDANSANTTITNKRKRWQSDDRAFHAAQANARQT